MMDDRITISIETLKIVTILETNSMRDVPIEEYFYYYSLLEHKVIHDDDFCYQLGVGMLGTWNIPSFELRAYELLNFELLVVWVC